MEAGSLGVLRVGGGGFNMRDLLQLREKLSPVNNAMSPSSSESATEGTSDTTTTAAAAGAAAIGVVVNDRLLKKEQREIGEECEANEPSAELSKEERVKRDVYVENTPYAKWLQAAEQLRYNGKTPYSFYDRL